MVNSIRQEYDVVDALKKQGVSVAIYKPYLRLLTKMCVLG